MRLTRHEAADLATENVVAGLLIASSGVGLFFGASILAAPLVPLAWPWLYLSHRRAEFCESRRLPDLAAWKCRSTMGLRPQGGVLLCCWCRGRDASRGDA